MALPEIYNPNNPIKTGKVTNFTLYKYCYYGGRKKTETGGWGD
jgi:hypothetical protein